MGNKARRQSHLAEPQVAEVRLRFGQKADLTLSARMTPSGLLAIGGLVSSILLSTAVIVHVAKRDREKAPLLRLPASR